MGILGNNGANAVDRNIGGALVYRTADQSLTSGVNTILTWPIGSATEVYDDGGFYNPGTNNDRFTIPTGYDGKYIVSVSTEYTSQGTGGKVLILWHHVSGDTPGVNAKVRKNTSHTGTSQDLTLTGVFDMAAGDFIVAGFFHNTGGGFNLLANGGTNRPVEFAIEKLR